MTKIKICGMTSIEDALAGAEAGADAIGFVFATSPRRIRPAMARKIAAALPPFVATVGVFVNQPLSEVRRICDYCRLDMIQLHGEESVGYCRSLGFARVIKAFRVKDGKVPQDISLYGTAGILFDTYQSDKQGGTGRTFDWKAACRIRSSARIFVSGGLDAGNVAKAIAMLRPYGVDVSSGVEVSPGKKDIHKMKAFIKEVRRCER